MTSISGISAIWSSYTIELASHRPKDGQDPPASVSKALSLSTDELKSQLKNGKRSCISSARCWTAATCSTPTPEHRAAGRPGPCQPTSARTSVIA
ncbi:hypothetical protein [Dactylosporangium sp. CA-233914]|uniref:hypothetical protein n=1 Tax=Dactylosporangium sp. CA-233914 TaxID=3239934 RepID=UPI003D9470FB